MQSSGRQSKLTRCGPRGLDRRQDVRFVRIPGQRGLVENSGADFEQLHGGLLKWGLAPSNDWILPTFSRCREVPVPFSTG